jgi:hypothetical protein
MIMQVVSSAYGILRRILRTGKVTWTEAYISDANQAAGTCMILVLDCGANVSNKYIHMKIFL